MAEAIEQVDIRRSALEEAHLRAGATMKVLDGWSVPASYGDELFEYASVREHGAGVIDLSSRGRLLVTGSEAVSFLNGLITNDMKTLDTNRWMPAAFPSVQGRLIASVRIINLQREGAWTRAEKPYPTFVIDTEAFTHHRVLHLLARFTMAGDFHLTDLTGETALLSIQGEEAERVIRAALRDATIALKQHEVQTAVWLGRQITIIRATHTSANGFDLLVDAADAQAVWDDIIKADGRPVGFDAFERLRIEAGEARYGVDMDETNVVTETNLDEAISYSKGCYIGQEIIARIKYRGHVAKKLTGLMFQQATPVKSGAAVKSLDGRDIGRLTSVTLSPHLARPVALGYVKFDFLAPGTTVKVLVGVEECPATIVELPFIRGSGHED